MVLSPLKKKRWRKVRKKHVDCVINKLDNARDLFLIEDMLWKKMLGRKEVTLGSNKDLSVRAHLTGAVIVEVETEEDLIHVQILVQEKLWLAQTITDIAYKLLIVLVETWEGIS